LSSVEEIGPEMLKSIDQSKSLLKVDIFEAVSMRKKLTVAANHFDLFSSADP
jgi:hypothetical protein